jgi:hypothetical protein
MLVGNEENGGAEAWGTPFLKELASTLHSSLQANARAKRE